MKAIFGQFICHIQFGYKLFKFESLDNFKSSGCTMKKVIFIILILGASVSPTVAQIPPYVSTNGLVGWWPFDDHANDLSGNNLNGIPTNVTATLDRYGETGMAYYFNGTNSNIRIPNNVLFNFSSNQDFTWSVWLQPAGNMSNTPEAGVISKWNEQLSQGYAYTIRVTDQNNGYSNVLAGNYFANAGDGNANVSGGLLQHGHYVHVVLRMENNVSQLFINNEMVSSVAFANGTVTNSFDLYFGRRHMHNSRWYKGAMDDAGVWDRALTDSEIAALYFSTPLSVEVVIPTGVLAIFPNPAQYAVNILTDSELIGEQYQLFNSLGVLVKKGVIRFEHTNIQMNDISRGTYFLKVGNEKEIHQIVKI
jgi:hypothetical protein